MSLIYQPWSLIHMHSTILALILVNGKITLPCLVDFKSRHLPSDLNVHSIRYRASSTMCSQTRIRCIRLFDIGTFTGLIQLQPWTGFRHHLPNIQCTRQIFEALPIPRIGQFSKMEKEKGSDTRFLVRSQIG